MKKTEKTESPMMKQYHELKAKHPDAVLLFRCGDFYETYEQDAEDISKILGITLTRRTNDYVSMAGFPYHALDAYLPKLIRAGKRVAICDQIEAPKTKIKNRGITEIVSPAPQPEVEEAQEAEAQPAEAKEEPKTETKKVEDMTIAELLNYVRKLEAENEKYQVLQIELKDAEKRANIESQKAVHWMNRAKQAEEKLEAIKNVINN